ncbi:glycine--tRNA ligase [Aestuariimicrobium soli]|uniref:glycine--tRNA ligase n=1 Tax=Aestuariimicrobium soli TaxID=2035834 RepID=UPI003EB8F67B
MQDALTKLSEYWTSRGCLIWQPFNTEVGAGTMNPATVLRVLGPEPWDVAYVEPSVRPDDSRYGENPNRLQTHTQFQVILKPEPGDPQELYLGSLEALGIDLSKHDVRFVEDNWRQPAIGAWGLGWEVWLDGMEITQFTYFQQVGGVNLDPIPVELTYGIERILMNLQGVTHFKDIAYATAADGRTITYGEAFGQQEYEMSRYYLDDADVEANRSLYETYVGEATRMVEARLPVPAHNYILKSSHAFNVLDARGAISTTERAKAFATMRRLMRDTANLWIERRQELGFPLIREAAAELEGPETTDPASLPTDPQTFALEIGLEELPPHEVPLQVAAVKSALESALGATRLEHGAVSVDGTPRRLVAIVEGVAAHEPDAEVLKKGPKWAAAFDADGKPTKPLEGFLRGQGVTLEQIEKADFNGAEHVAVRSTQTGRAALEVLAGIVEGIVTGLRAEKNMRWNDPSLSYSRAIRWLVALWGPAVVPARVSDVVAGRVTRLQRDAAGFADDVVRGEVSLASAAELVPALVRGGIVLASDERRSSVVSQAIELAASVGGTIDVDGESALVDEITHLVEQPFGVLGGFDEKYLELPERVLTTVMRKHQRYLPVYAADGSLAPHFVTMANGACDPELVAAGNGSVVRARYEDAQFFWNSDLKAERADEFVPGLEQLTFEETLGSVGARARRIAEVAGALAGRVSLAGDELATLERAGQLAKFDLSSQMVVEMSSLAGFVAREYAARLGETQQVADALYEMEQPHTSADAVPASVPGALLALADRFDLLAGLFAVGAKPTGSSDQFGLRRAALGVVRILREKPELAAITVRDGITDAVERVRAQGVEVADDAIDAAVEFTVARYAQLLRDEGVSADLVAAVQPAAEAPGVAQALLAQMQSRLESDDLRALVAALVRITRILPAGVEATYDEAVLSEPAEKELAALVGHPVGHGQFGEFVDGSAELVAKTQAFFDQILVMADDPAVKAARLGLLASVLASAPAGVDWRALDLALG